MTLVQYLSILGPFLFIVVAVILYFKNELKSIRQELSFHKELQQKDITALNESTKETKTFISAQEETNEENEEVISNLLTLSDEVDESIAELFTGVEEAHEKINEVAKHLTGQDLFEKLGRKPN